VSAYLFPGQGSQVAGMRDEVARLRPDLLDTVGEIVGEDPFERVEESTRFAQPAILCSSLARWSVLDAEADVLLGHSLGELAALAAAGAIGEREALELVVERGRLMADAAAPGDGMLAALGGDATVVRALADHHGVTVANDNAPGQLVLSGGVAALDAFAGEAKARGVRTMTLAVRGAFHSPAMESAREAWVAALAEVEFAEPAVPVVSCLTAAPIGDARRALADSLTHPVRFREALLHLAAGGATRFVDVGPGRILERLVRRTLPDLQSAVAEVGARA
jgi:acyl transferase domain-containing protein